VFGEEALALATIVHLKVFIGVAAGSGVEADSFLFSSSSSFQAVNSEWAFMIVEITHAYGFCS